ncbi:MAG: L-glyceraldehyde 3-phosphate reductase [Ruminococcaceae bacterium]|nr:L-glyceraldehyde 3-phosphate reductase [Oscillospiraceae bacterium]
MYKAEEKRYDGRMPYRRCGRSGLMLPAVSLGLWQNFGAQKELSAVEEMIHTAFDLGIVHFDLANNYGAPYNGSAEENFGRVMAASMRPYRDEMCISTKAGYGMWPGPYGTKNGSRKYLISSLDQSLARMGLEYVDIFYHHVPDPETPVEETALALDQIVRSGKALYVGVSNYRSAQMREILPIFRELHTPFVVNQPSYSMLNRWIEEDGLYGMAAEEGFGFAVFSPLQQGLLTDKYLHGIPADSRYGKNERMQGQITPGRVAQLQALHGIAENRGQTLSQLALAWCLRDARVATVLAGASRAEHVRENALAAQNTAFSAEEISAIEEILG